MVRKNTIEQVNRYVIEKYEGECLSTEYINNRTDLLWKCKREHSWQDYFNNITQGRWCRECYFLDNISRDMFDPLTLEDAQQDAAKREGKCLSTEYKNTMTPMLWECKEKHTWFAIYNNVRHHNRWCPTCADNKKLTIEIAREEAIKRGGTCLSVIYVNAQKKLTFKCKNEHIFEMNLNHIRSRGHWCPYCNLWSCEEIVRVTFQTIFNQKFKRCRPEWLTFNGNRIELDGLSETTIEGRHLAFEHQGEQHYKSGVCISFPNDEQSLAQMQLRDAAKVKQCKKNNVALIIIPQLFKMTTLKQMRTIIKNELILNNITVPENIETIEIDYYTLYSDDFRFNQIKEIVESKGGKCISNKYINNQIKMEIECAKTHHIWLTPNAIKNGTWCKFCNREERYGNFLKC